MVQSFKSSEVRAARDQTCRQPRRVLAPTIVVLVAYALARWFVYRQWPVDSLESWFLRDVAMDGPRCIAFVACLVLARRITHWRAELSVRVNAPGLIVALATTVLWFWHFSASEGGGFTGPMMVVGCVSSLLVGLFEELVMRGLILAHFAERHGRPFAVLVTTGIFMVFHIQAQAWTYWPPIFLVGVVLANLRYAGASLFFLALMHGAIDSFYFLFGGSTPDPSSAHGVVFCAMMGIGAIGSFGLKDTGIFSPHKAQPNSA